MSANFLISAEMMHHTHRNCKVLLMDTTFNTNRFHGPLCLVCAVEEHYHTVLAVALICCQTTGSSEWVLAELYVVMSAGRSSRAVYRWRLGHVCCSRHCSTACPPSALQVSSETEHPDRVSYGWCR